LALFTRIYLTPVRDYRNLVNMMMNIPVPQNSRNVPNIWTTITFSKLNNCHFLKSALRHVDQCNSLRKEPAMLSVHITIFKTIL